MSQAALAIAHRFKRKKMAKGGRVGYAPGGAMPYGVPRSAQRGASGGLINSAVPGRSDQIPMSPKGRSYVIPADVVSSLGQGNTSAGAKGLSKFLGMGPYGMPAGKPPAMPQTPMPGKGFAEGGGTEGNVDIMAAGGEFVVPPEKVAEVGGGDIDRGEKILDTMVQKQRKKTIKTLRKLPGPRKR
jgi:hypothetical protein